MYYSVAIQVEAQPAWKWQSTALSSLNIVLQWLQVYRAFPQERLRIFSSPERAELNEQLARENQGRSSTSLPATQFLQARGMSRFGRGACSPQRTRERRTFMRGTEPLDAIVMLAAS